MQSKAQCEQYQDAQEDTINSFYKLLNTIDKDYEITITGGEAILHPKFFEIIEHVKKLGFKINLITNLSFKIETYQKIFDILGGSLNKFDVSFHLNEIQSFNLMLEKLITFLKNKPKNTKTTFFIPLYKIDSKKELKIDKIIRIAKKFNIEVEFQKIRFLNQYKEDKNKKYVSQNIKRKTYAKLCFAGCESAVIYEDGNAYRCYSSRFLKSNFLGNINDENFELNASADVCTNCYCMCPKPQAYNQICIEKDYKTAVKNSLLNLIYLPILLYKNKNIVKIKLKQFLNI